MVQTVIGIALEARRSGALLKHGCFAVVKLHYSMGIAFRKVGHPTGSTS